MSWVTGRLENQASDSLAEADNNQTNVNQPTRLRTLQDAATFLESKSDKLSQYIRNGIREYARPIGILHHTNNIRL